MKKRIILFVVLFMTTFTSFAQIGIGINEPKATLDVKAVQPTGNSTSTDGILIPRVDRQRAQNMASVETSTLIYVNNIATGTATGKAINIDAIGFYSFNGSEWQKFGTAGTDSSIYNNDGTLQANRTVTMNDKNLAFNSTATTGTSHFNVDGATLNVDAVNDRVGVGTMTPKGALDITSTTGALIPPRMTTTQRDALVLPPTGALVFNTSANSIQFNSGTEAIPNWSNLEASGSTKNTNMFRVANSARNFTGQGVQIPTQTLLFDNTEGFVTYASGRYTLKAGKTYKLEFSAAWVTNGSTYSQFRWYNVTAGAYLGTVQHFEHSSSPAATGGGGLATALIAPSTDIVVEPRYLRPSATVSLGVSDAPAYPYAFITVLD